MRRCSQCWRVFGLTTHPSLVQVRQQASAAARIGPVRQALTIIRLEGLTTLWSGLRPALGITVPATVIYMSAYEKLREGISVMASAKWATPAVPMVAGGLARVLSGVATAPLELLRTRAQAGPAGPGGDIVALARREGPMALWRGLSASLARDVPFSCLYWVMYEQLKVCLQMEPTPAVSMIAAGAAAAIAAVPTTPFDVVKTRAQVLEAPPPSLSRALYELYLREGSRALFAGVVPRVIKMAPSCAIIVGVYEMGKQQVVRYRRRRG